MHIKIDNREWLTCKSVSLRLLRMTIDDFKKDMRLFAALALATIALQTSALGKELCPFKGPRVLEAGMFGLHGRSFEDDPCYESDSVTCTVDPKNSWLWLVKKNSLNAPTGNFCKENECISAGAVATMGEGYDPDAGEKLKKIVESKALESLTPDLRVLPKASSFVDERLTGVFIKKGNKLTDFRISNSSIYGFRLTYLDKNGKRISLSEGTEGAGIYKLIQVSCNEAGDAKAYVTHYWWLRAVKDNSDSLIPFDVFIKVAYIASPKAQGLKSGQNGFSGF